MSKYSYKNKKSSMGYYARLCWQKIYSFGHWYKGLYKGKAWYKKTGIGFISFIIAFIVYLAAVDINLFWLFGKSPGMETISHPTNNEASEIYSADGVLIGKYFNENRSPVKFEEINPVFWNALISTEDERFYQHFGIDFQGLFSAAKDMILHHHARGASTITQQLVKNMFRVRTEYSTGLMGYIPGLKIIIMKSKEWITAVKIEMFFSKKDILTMYANTVDFGSNAYGIKTACKTYFNTTPKDMTTEQAAVLVGMLKATTYYNPLINPKNCRNRRNVVLENMVSHGKLSRTSFDSISAIPIKLNYSVESNYDGKALYFREAVADYLKSWCKENGIDLYRDGLKIYTTVDTKMQKYAEEAVNKQMRIVQRNFKNHWGNEEPWQDENHHVIPDFIQGLARKTITYKQLVQQYPNNPDSVSYYLNKPHTVKVYDYEKGVIEKQMSTMDSIRYMEHFMHCGFVAMEPNTGYIKAWVGDIDFQSWKYDKVTSMRQPGSTFKLFVYTEAMNQGLTPCDKRRDQFVSMKVFDKMKQQEVMWTPSNSNGYFTGDSMPLKSAFAQSVNSIAVRLGQEVGISNIIKTAHDMGISSPLDETPSLALGSSDVNLLEMVNAYSTVINDGKYHEPILVTKIVDKDGNVIYQAPTEQKQVIPYRSAFLMQQMLQGGMRELGGTSMSLWGYISPFAHDTDFGGKTGTTNNHSDAWFIGVSPNLIGGAWVGGEYRCIHFRTGALGQGSRTALPVFGYFMQKVLADPQFKRYHGKFAKAHDDIAASAYNCMGVAHQRKETAERDSTDQFEEVTDEEGATTTETRESEPTTATTTPSSATEPSKEITVPKKKKKKTEQAVSFDDVMNGE
jgi:penicillin-binding protein 1A